MFDMGWLELCLVIFVFICLFGSKDLPQALRYMGRGFKAFQGLRRRIHQWFYDLMGPFYDEGERGSDHRLKQQQSKQKVSHSHDN